MSTGRYWIDKLGLAAHPEGGFYRETYRAPVTLNSGRSTCTAIYFLLQGDDFSAFHKLASDELWHFYAGEALAVHIIDEHRRHVELTIGANLERGEAFQAVVPAGTWFGSCLLKPNTFALVGCTVSPGFDFADFALADRSQLLAAYPEHTDLIARLTRA